MAQSSTLTGGWTGFSACLVAMADDINVLLVALPGVSLLGSHFFQVIIKKYDTTEMALFIIDMSSTTDIVG